MKPAPTEWFKVGRCPGMDPLILAQIVRRRRQMLVHSCIYYELNGSLITDHTWQAWADELATLQAQHGEKVDFFDGSFSGWNGSTGFHLPLRDPDILRVARRTLDYAPKESPERSAMALTTPVNLFTIESQPLEKDMSQLILNPLPTQEAPPQTAAAPAANPVTALVNGMITKGDTPFDALVKTYLAVRDKKQQLDTQAKERTAPLSAALTNLENHMLGRMQAIEVDSVKTAHGTPYIAKKTTYSVADASEFQRFILREALAKLPLPDATRSAIIASMLDSGALALMETRAAKSAIEQFVATRQAEAEAAEQEVDVGDILPAGLNVRTERTVNVRAS
jgi:hypothetical protein